MVQQKHAMIKTDNIKNAVKVNTLHDVNIIHVRALGSVAVQMTIK